MTDTLRALEETADDLARAAAIGSASITYVDASGSTVHLPPEVVSAIAARATRKRREFNADDESRTTAFGLLRYAHNYGQAARLVAKSVKGDGHYSPVASMLIGHSIELSLKAYLRSRGATLADIHRLGHDLGKAYKKCLKLRIDRLVDLPDEHGLAVREYGKHHMGGEFRYIRNGSKSVPSWADMSIIAHLLTTNLRRHCVRSTFGRAKALEVLANRGDRF